MNAQDVDYIAVSATPLQFVAQLAAFAVTAAVVFVVVVVLIDWIRR